jgi:protein involved in sex pheromone biosynthesis
VEEENRILSVLLPQYLTKSEILEKIVDIQNDIKGAKNEGVATGLAMKLLKGLKLPVEGDTVKQAVQELRDSKIAEANCEHSGLRA